MKDKHDKSTIDAFDAFDEAIEKAIEDATEHSTMVNVSDDAIENDKIAKGVEATVDAIIEEVNEKWPETDVGVLPVSVVIVGEDADLEEDGEFIRTMFPSEVLVVVAKLNGTLANGGAVAGYGTNTDWDEDKKEDDPDDKELNDVVDALLADFKKALEKDPVIKMANELEEAGKCVDFRSLDYRQ